MLTCCLFSELYTLMKDQDEGVRELKLEQDNRLYNHCFSGTAVLGFFFQRYRCWRLFLSLSFSSNILNTFTASLFYAGATVVEWLVSKGKARNSAEALMLATGLLNEGFLQPAGDLSKDAAESGEQTAFLEDPKALYYFVSSPNSKCVAFIINRSSVQAMVGN